MAKKERAGFVLYFADLAALAEVMDEAGVGRLVLALSTYAQNGQEPNFTDDASKMAFGLLKCKIDRDREHYAAVSESRAEAARKRVLEKEHLQQLIRLQQIGKGIGEENVTGGGSGYGMSIDPRITALENLKTKYAGEECEND